VLCVAANLGPGLRYDSVTGQIAVRISTDGDNATIIGSDGGIYTPGPDASPDPSTGRKTIAGLPEQAVAASSGGAGAMAPLSSPYALEYGVANGIDIITLNTFALADNIAIARVAAPGTSISSNTDNPSTIVWRNISSIQLPSLNVDAGTRVNPTGNLTGAPAAQLTPDGGWFGFYAHQYAPMTLEQSLWQLAARQVAQLAVYGNDIEANVERSLAAAIDAVITVGSGAWTLVGVPGYVNDGGGNIVQSPLNTWVASVTGAGLTPIVDLFDEPDAVDPYTVAEILASGTNWVRIHSPGSGVGITSGRIAALVGAGLQVNAVTSSRHVDVEAMYTAGVRAITADSPVYARGARGEPGDLNYRKRIVIPGLQARTTMEGALTQVTDDGIGREEAGYARLGEVGRYFPPMWEWVGGIGDHLMSQLLGEICPIEVSSGYILRLRFRVTAETPEFVVGSVPKLGVFFASDTDENIEYADGDPQAHINGYWFNVRIGSTDTGDITLGKFNDGVFTTLNTSLSFASVDYDEWFNFTITVVDSTEIQFFANHDGVTTATVVINDADHRGAYAFYGWEDDYALPADNAGFGHGYAPFSTFATTGPMIELLP
jgi:hypothetical protein